ncbi:MAG: cell division protein FtsL, partial [Acetobacteraceae bacterium]
MIRPATVLTAVLACASGFYLFQAKHHAQVLRHEIDRAVRTADAARARTAELRAEWALLNDPLRLQRLAAKFLDLKPMRPTQFLTLGQ